MNEAQKSKKGLKFKSKVLILKKSGAGRWSGEMGKAACVQSGRRLASFLKIKSENNPSFFFRERFSWTRKARQANHVASTLTPLRYSHPHRAPWAACWKIDIVAMPKQVILKKS
jgi:hypothetical protein